MIISKLSKVLLIASTLFILQVNAQEEQLTCEDTYNQCIDKCDNMENPSESCYISCDDLYSKCLESEETSQEQEK